MHTSIVTRVHADNDHTRTVAPCQHCRHAHHQAHPTHTHGVSETREASGWGWWAIHHRSPRGLERRDTHVQRSTRGGIAACVTGTTLAPATTRLEADLLHHTQQSPSDAHYQHTRTDMGVGQVEYGAHWLEEHRRVS